MTQPQTHTQYKKKVSITGGNKYSPIHTIPAPNLSYYTGSDQYHEPIDNHLHEKDQYNSYSAYRKPNVIIFLMISFLIYAIIIIDFASFRCINIK